MSGFAFMAPVGLRANTTEHVFYVSQDGHVRELFWNGVWQGNDLTASTNGPVAAQGPLTSFFDGSSEHVFYISQGDSHVRELYWNGNWYGNDLTASTNGPSAVPVALTSFFDQGTEHVFYVSRDRHVRELYWNGGWFGDDLTAMTKGPLTVSGLTGFLAHDVFERTFHVFYVSQDGHVRELYNPYTPFGWHGSDLTASTNGPLAKAIGLTSFFDTSFNGIIEHVFYISQGDSHVRQLYWNGNWQGTDLTADTNGSPLLGTSPMTSFSDSIIEHVFYISQADGHVRELYNNNGTWQGNDLTAKTNGPLAKAIGLTSFFNGPLLDAVEQVFYISQGDSHVRELFYNGNAWQGNDLTGSTNDPVAGVFSGLTSFTAP